MRYSLFPMALVVLLTTACETPAGTNAQIETPAGPLDGTGLRLDGYYRFDQGEVIRLMRFFPKGNVVVINGTKEAEKDLHLFLTPTIKSDPVHGLHNVPVRVDGDSLFFRVFPEKGEIDFRGIVASASTLNFERYSHINGARQTMEYIFQPDPVQGPAPDSTQ